jgi:metallophosphoesterase (TIGR00282 family)
MKLLFIGDIVGQVGVDCVRGVLPALIARESLDVVIANAENAANGSGLTPRQYRQLRQAGVDLITMGDHVYKKLDVLAVLDKEDRICRPANFPADAPGRELVRATARDGTAIAACTILGRTFMRPTDCPFRAADRILAQLGPEVKCIFVDVHAEATADKYLLVHHLKGRVSAVLGTHTHVPTADEQIMAGGTAFISDVGMTGPYDSILGRRIDRVLKTAITFLPAPFDVAEGDVRLGGAIVEIDAASGRATAIRRVMIHESHTTPQGESARPAE